MKSAAATVVLIFIQLMAGGCGATSAPAYPRELVSPVQETTRSFAYTRIGPDGSMLSGQIDLGLARRPEGMFETAVTFRAEGVVFSRQQAQAIEPTFEWPASHTEYPLELTGLNDTFSYRLPLRQACDAGEIAVFWSYGLYHYLGMHTPPTHFVARQTLLDAETQTLLIRGAFLRQGCELGQYSFTFRAGRGLCAVAGVLADGTVVTLVELGGEGPAPVPPPAPDEDLWFAQAK